LQWSEEFIFGKLSLPNKNVNNPSLPIFATVKSFDPRAGFLQKSVTGCKLSKK
jgi:hypothetical protein